MRSLATTGADGERRRLPGLPAAAGPGAPLEPPAAGPSPRRFVRPDLAALPLYHLDPSPARFKLDQNEVPWDLPRRLKEEVARRLLDRDWARYGDFHSEELRRAVGERQGWPAAGVLVGNGSNELLAMALEALVAPGTEVLGADPSFGLYPAFVARSGGAYRPLPARDDLAIPFAELLAAVETVPQRPLLLCTPNNPTGAALSVDQVEALLSRLEAPLLLDNAYGELGAHDYRPLLARHPHLLLFRTFSKAWSLAGLRAGFLLAHPDLVGELLKVKLPYNLGHAAAIAAAVALEEAAVAERRVRLLVGRRGQWARALARGGWEVLPSEANFLLVRCGRGDAARPAVERARQALLARGVLVRDVSRGPGLAGCFRISIGTAPALAAVAAAIDDLSGAGAARGGDGR
jgi:histidinol-phosphate aminotransferase